MDQARVSLVGGRYRRNILSMRWIVCCWLGAVIGWSGVAAGGLRCQIPMPGPGTNRGDAGTWPNNSGQQDPQRSADAEAARSRPLLSLDPAELLRDQLAPGYRLNRDLPLFQGFPSFPPAVLRYPGQTKPGLPVPFAPGVTVPGRPGTVPPRRPDQWPSWFLADERDGNSFAPTRAILSRTGERVWTRPADERVFVPLAFYDKFRVLSDGDQVEVRHQGEFQITFHGSANLRSRGPARLTIQTLNEEIVAFELSELTRAWWVLGQRPVRVTLAGGVVVEGIGAECDFERRGELTAITNHGDAEVTLSSPLGQVPVLPGHRVLVSRSARLHPPRGAELTLQGDLSPQREGRELRVKAGVRGGTVIWNGARIRLPGGASLRLDPLDGKEFPNQKTQRP